MCNIWISNTNSNYVPYHLFISIIYDELILYILLMYKLSQLDTDTHAKFEFQIQIQIMYRISSDKSVYIVIIYIED